MTDKTDTMQTRRAELQVLRTLPRTAHTPSGAAAADSGLHVLRQPRQTVADPYCSGNVRARHALGPCLCGSRPQKGRTRRHAPSQQR